MISFRGSRRFAAYCFEIPEVSSKDAEEAPKLSRYHIQGESVRSAPFWFDILEMSSVRILCFTILYYTILYYTLLYYTLLYYTILYHTILYYTILYYTILYYTIL